MRFCRERESLSYWLQTEDLVHFKSTVGFYVLVRDIILPSFRNFAHSTNAAGTAVLTYLVQRRLSIAKGSGSVGVSRDFDVRRPRGRELTVGFATTPTRLLFMFSFVFFVDPIEYLRFFLSSFSLIDVTHIQDHKAGSFSPLPTNCCAFVSVHLEKNSALSSPR